LAGICFFTSDGTRIVNCPEQHKANCTTKRQATNMWFKPMVRILKNMRSRLVDDGEINDGSAPSTSLRGCSITCLTTSSARAILINFQKIMHCILQADRSQFYARTDNIIWCGIRLPGVGRARTATILSTLWLSCGTTGRELIYMTCPLLLADLCSTRSMR
jgi:hypothetical protein